MQLTNALLPLLLRSAAQTCDARIVNVVSMLHTRGRNEFLFTPITPYNSWVAYGTSKLALVHATFELQRHHAAAGLQAYRSEEHTSELQSLMRISSADFCLKKKNKSRRKTKTKYRNKTENT